jgi:hypothetical protein
MKKVLVKVALGSLVGFSAISKLVAETVEHRQSISNSMAFRGAVNKSVKALLPNADRVVIELAQAAAIYLAESTGNIVTPRQQGC